ncbi:MAG: DnaJ domain-containing protein [Thermodesulfobacteriota bacterium]
MKDYYEVLGLEEDASQEEIRERWLELTKIYHPDVLKSPDADERIKEINEAYQVLKDYSSRLEYDLQRALQKSVLNKVAEKEKKKSSWPKVILPASVLVVVIFMIYYLFLKIPTQPGQPVKMPVPEQGKIIETMPPSTLAPGQVAELEKEKPIIPGEKLSPPKTEPAKPEEKKPILAKAVIKKEEKKEAEKVKIITPLKTPEPVKIIPPEKPQIQSPKLEPLQKPTFISPAPHPQKIEVEEKKEKPMEIAKTPAPEVVKKLTPPPPEPKKLEEEKGEKKPVKHAEIPPDIKPEPAKIIPPVQPEIIEAKKPEKLEISEKPMPSKEEEVNKFLTDYVSKYKQKDAEGFLANFSTQAIQNQKYKLGDIKRIYKNFFEGSQEVDYILQDVQTLDHPQGLEVRAKYELHQVAKKDGEKKFWKGRIRWILVRENGRLKIISLDYQHQK